ncbi:MAG: hypothetical protein ACP5T5_05970 [Thermoprotei archaeon]
MTWGPVLREMKRSFPAWFTERVDELAYFSRVLRREREPSTYGDYGKRVTARPPLLKKGWRGGP